MPSTFRLAQVELATPPISAWVTIWPHRTCAPYFDVSWQRQSGDTRRFSRARGEDIGGLSFAAGFGMWFQERWLES